MNVFKWHAGALLNLELELLTVLLLVYLLTSNTERADGQDSNCPSTIMHVNSVEWRLLPLWKSYPKAPSISVLTLFNLSQWRLVVRVPAIENYHSGVCVDSPLSPGALFRNTSGFRSGHLCVRVSV